MKIKEMLHMIKFEVGGVEYWLGCMSKGTKGGFYHKATLYNEHMQEINMLLTDYVWSKGETCYSNPFL